jgi:hypothetical protein
MGGDPSGRRKKRSLGSHQECQLGNQNEVPMEVILRVRIYNLLSIYRSLDGEAV